MVTPLYVPSEDFKMRLHDERYADGWLMISIVEVCHKYTKKKIISSPPKFLEEVLMNT